MEIDEDDKTGPGQANVLYEGRQKLFRGQGGDMLVCLRLIVSALF